MILDILKTTKQNTVKQRISRIQIINLPHATISHQITVAQTLSTSINFPMKGCKKFFLVSIY